MTSGTNDYGIYIAGADTYAIFVDAGNSRFDGLVSVGLGSTASTTAVCSSLANGTAPTSATAYELRDCSGTPAADYAEMYPVASDVEPGDLVAPGSESVLTKDGDQITKLIKTNKPYQETMIGIISDPTKITDFNAIGYNIDEKDNPQPVSLSGRVLVKVSTENGPIEPGDLLTSSSIPGVAMKATKAGPVIGKALEAFNGSQGKVMVFVNLSYYLPTENLEKVDSSQENSPTFVDLLFSDINGFFTEGLKKLGLILENGIARVKELFAERVTTKQICVEGDDGETICLDKNQLKELLEKNSQQPTSNEQTNSPQTEQSPDSQEPPVEQPPDGQ